VIPSVALRAGLGVSVIVGVRVRAGVSVEVGVEVDVSVFVGYGVEVRARVGVAVQEKAIAVLALAVRAAISSAERKEGRLQALVKMVRMKMETRIFFIGLYYALSQSVEVLAGATRPGSTWMAMVKSRNNDDDFIRITWIVRKCGIDGGVKKTLR